MGNEHSSTASYSSYPLTKQWPPLWVTNPRNCPHDQTTYHLRGFFLSSSSVQQIYNHQQQRVFEILDIGENPIYVATDSFRKPIGPRGPVLKESQSGQAILSLRPRRHLPQPQSGYDVYLGGDAAFEFPKLCSVELESADEEFGLVAVCRNESTREIIQIFIKADANTKEAYFFLGHPKRDNGVLIAKITRPRFSSSGSSSGSSSPSMSTGSPVPSLCSSPSLPPSPMSNFIRSQLALADGSVRRSEDSVASFSSTLSDDSDFGSASDRYHSLSVAADVDVALIISLCLALDEAVSNEGGSKSSGLKSVLKRRTTTLSSRSAAAPVCY
ncbi:hypothetical protein HK102_000246 [Quaeritorhiza haematococci]|nr:hypothetical protein HK102_000246 [Quaeritorhiza haematococci]